MGRIRTTFLSSLPYWCFACVLFVVSSSEAQKGDDAKGPVVILPEILLPSPPPNPPPAPDAPIKMDASQLFVLRSKADCVVIASPASVVRVTTETGPLRIRAIFVGGTPGYETKTFTEKNIWIVEAIATGTAELIVVPIGGTEKDIVRRTIDANVGPRPPPIPPVPPVPPDPKPDPAPIPLAGFRVLIVYDPATLTKDQEGIVFGKATRDYLQAKCVVGADGKTKDFWILQSGVDVSAAPKWIGDVIQRHPGQKTFMVISDGKTGYDGAIPADATEALKVLKKVGGE